MIAVAAHLLNVTGGGNCPDELLLYLCSYVRPIVTQEPSASILRWPLVSGVWQQFIGNTWSIIYMVDLSYIILKRPIVS